MGRVLLGLVLSWFGYHELVQPSLWTGYVPLVSGSAFLVLLVLAHGWLLLMLAVAMFAGIAVRAVAALSAVLMIEIVTSLTITERLVGPGPARRGRARACCLPDSTDPTATGPHRVDPPARR